MHDRTPRSSELAAFPARVTIPDVALKAGVSKATVSRFLNRRQELLTPEIAVRVDFPGADQPIHPADAQLRRGLRDLGR